jgi:hypothetical protein
MGVINDVMEGTKIRIGKIDMDKTFSRIDVEERYAVEIASRLAGAKTGSYTINAYFEEGENAKPHRSSRGNYGGGRREDRNRRGGRNQRSGFDSRNKRDFDKRSGGRSDFEERPRTRREDGEQGRFGRDFGDRLEARGDRPRRKRIGEDSDDKGKRRSSHSKSKGSSKFKGAPRKRK